MAIVIPSSKTYDRQNPKVRDNVIERIEVGAVEVVQNNEFDIPVHNKEENNFYSVEKEYKFDFQKTYKSAPDNFNFVTAISYSGYKETKLFEETKILIPILLNNKRIVKIKLGEDSEEEPNIKYNLFGLYKYGTVTCPYSGELVWISGDNYNFNVSYDISNSYFYKEMEEQEGHYSIPKEFTKTIDGTVWEGQKFEIEITSKISVVETGNLKTANIVKENINNAEYVSITLKDILCGVKSITMGGANRTNAGVGTGFPISGTMTGIWEEYIPQYIEITIYGNTIGIDLTDKTVYINGGTAKKVHSIEGNELMQTSNYEEKETELVENTDYRIGTSSNVSQTYFYTSVHLYNKYPLDTYVDYTFPSGETATAVIKAFDTTHRPAIESTGGFVTINRVYRPLVATTYDYFKQTQEDYSNGKETATIRCSISDYYDYEDRAKKLISIDNSTGKMSFKMYDQVIPMVYGADGQDRPMSTYQDGSPKIFQVLGTKIFYDGAVWQELSLQEV